MLPAGVLRNAPNNALDMPSLPPCRQACALCIGHGNLLFVHGGRNNFVLEDLHVMDFVVSARAGRAGAGCGPGERGAQGAEEGGRDAMLYAWPVRRTRARRATCHRDVYTHWPAYER